MKFPDIQSSLDFPLDCTVYTMIARCLLTVLHVPASYLTIEDLG